MVVPRKVLTKLEKLVSRKTPRKKLENEIEEIKVEAHKKKPKKEKARHVTHGGPFLFLIDKKSFQ